MLNIVVPGVAAAVARKAAGEGRCHGGDEMNYGELRADVRSGGSVKNITIDALWKPASTLGVRWNAEGEGGKEGGEGTRTGRHAAGVPLAAGPKGGARLQGLAPPVGVR